MVEETIIALSRFRHLFFIICNSSFTYKGRSVDVKQIGHELGVRYVPEGSVRKVEPRAHRWAAHRHLDGVHLWADRIAGALEEHALMRCSTSSSWR